jgi:hypothetical protein
MSDKPKVHIVNVDDYTMAFLDGEFVAAHDNRGGVLYSLLCALRNRGVISLDQEIREDFAGAQEIPGSFKEWEEVRDAWDQDPPLIIEPLDSLVIGRDRGHALGHPWYRVPGVAPSKRECYRARGEGVTHTVTDPQQIKDQLAEENPDALLADGFDQALIGVARRCGQPPLAVYNYDLAVMLLCIRDKMTPEEAHEHMDFNVVGAWMGPNTPVWLYTTSET